MYLTNYIFTWTFFHIAFYKIFKNGCILIIHRSFFQENDSLQLDRFQILKINSLMAETIITNLPKQNSYKEIAEFGNKLFNLEN